jgi:transcriptional regulator with XRE-family HTH domain
MATRDDPVGPQVGKTIQRLRQAYKLSLGELAEQSGVSKSIISQIERNEANPTLSTIWRLSQALRTSLDEVLRKESGPDPFLDTIAGNATPIIHSEDGLCVLRILGPIETVSWLQWYSFDAEPGGVLESSPHPLGTVEHLTISKGRLAIEVDGERREAKAGETLRYRGDVPHRIENIGDGPAAAWMVLSCAGRIATE